MGSALWIAISGLNASSKQMDVIGNNIANATTDMQLARTLGEAVNNAYKGELDYHYTEEAIILRVNWRRGAAGCPLTPITPPLVRGGVMGAWPCVQRSSRTRRNTPALSASARRIQGNFFEPGLALRSSETQS